MPKSILLVTACIFVVLAQPVAAQSNPRDKAIPADAAAPAVNWKGQAWWMPLAQCAVIYRSAPANQAMADQFLSAAVDRVEADRGVAGADAASIVASWNQTRGQQRAATSIDVLGIDDARAVCDALLAQYQAS